MLSCIRTHRVSKLIDTDPVVRLYLNEMIAEVPQRKLYRKRHLTTCRSFCA